MSWVKPGVRVNHNRYGAGVVLTVAKDIIKVRFGQTERTLSYPGIFENGILTKPISATEPPRAKGPEWAVAGAAVTHKSFGNGVIETIDGSHMSVRFGNVVKPFLYPGAFTDGHLTKGNSKTAPVESQMKLFSDKRMDFLLIFVTKVMLTIHRKPWRRRFPELEITQSKRIYSDSII